jgi:hypothetical protein
MVLRRGFNIIARARGEQKITLDFQLDYLNYYRQLIYELCFLKKKKINKNFKKLIFLMYLYYF